MSARCITPAVSGFTTYRCRTHCGAPERSGRTGCCRRTSPFKTKTAVRRFGAGEQIAGAIRALHDQATYGTQPAEIRGLVDELLSGSDDHRGLWGKDCQVVEVMGAGCLPRSPVSRELLRHSGARDALDGSRIAPGTRPGHQAFRVRRLRDRELVAELGAAFPCADLDLTLEPREDHAAYIANWLEVLKADYRAIFTAASHAQRASTSSTACSQPSGGS